MATMDNSRVRPQPKVFGRQGFHGSTVLRGTYWNFPRFLERLDR